MKIRLNPFVERTHALPDLDKRVYQGLIGRSQVCGRRDHATCHEAVSMGKISGRCIDGKIQLWSAWT